MTGTSRPAAGGTRRTRGWWTWPAAPCWWSAMAASAAAWRNYCRAFQMKVLVMDPGFHPMRIAADGFTPARDLHAALAEARCGDAALPAVARDAPPDGRRRLRRAEARRHPGEHRARPDRLAGRAGRRAAGPAGCTASGSTCWRSSPPTPATRSMPSRMSSSARTTPPAPRKAWRAWRGRRHATSSTCWTASATQPSWSTHELGNL